jgi:membrane-bound lytic murein transglycosylase D
MYAYVQHDLKENPFQNSRAVVKSDENSSETRTTTRSATKYYKRGDNGLIANKYDVCRNQEMEWTERQYYREKFKIITTETVVQTVKKEPKAALASVDVKSLKPKEVRTDISCEYCNCLYRTKG